MTPLHGGKGEESSRCTDHMHYGPCMFDQSSYSTQGLTHQEVDYCYANVQGEQRCQLQENKNPQSDGQKSPEIPRSQFQGKTR